jgi:hypothetical protein
MAEYTRVPSMVEDKWDDDQDSREEQSEEQPFLPGASQRRPPWICLHWTIFIAISAATLLLGMGGGYLLRMLIWEQWSRLHTSSNPVPEREHAIPPMEQAENRLTASQFPSLFRSLNISRFTRGRPPQNPMQHGKL